MIRLNKYLSECGIASRRKSEEVILQGRIYINGVKVTDLAQKINPDTDKITFDGEPVFQERKEYFILNKPKGYITAINDEKDRKNVVDLINTSVEISPVGRLDYNTTGVLILTNDGEFTNYLSHPSNKFEREFFVVLDKPLSNIEKEKLLKGVFIDNKRSKFTKIEFPETKNFKVLNVTFHDARNHFVKDMFKVIGFTVKQLHRLSFAGINVNNIPEGKYHKVTKEDLEHIIKSYAKKNK